MQGDLSSEDSPTNYSTLVRVAIYALFYVPIVIMTANGLLTVFAPELVVKNSMQGISVSELWDRSTVAGSVAELYIRGIGMLMFTWWGIIAPLFINPFSYRSIWIVSPNVGMIFVLSFLRLL